MPLSSSPLLDLSLGAIIMLALVCSYINLKLKFAKIIYLSTLLCIVLSLQIFWIYHQQSIPSIFFPSISLLVPVLKANIDCFNPLKKRNLWDYLPALVFLMLFSFPLAELWQHLMYAIIGLYVALSGLQVLIWPKAHLDIKLKHFFALASISISIIGFLIFINTLKLNPSTFTLQIQLQYIVPIFSVLLLLYSCLYFCTMIHAMIQPHSAFRTALNKLKADSPLLKKASPPATADLEAYAKKLNELMLPEVYLNHKLGLNDLAKKLKMPPHQLSVVFKEALETNFYSYVNEYRIKHALSLIEHQAAHTKGMENLAYSCGFNNRASFNRYFKAVTGHTPSAYLEELTKRKK